MGLIRKEGVRGVDSQMQSGMILWFIESPGVVHLISCMDGLHGKEPRGAEMF